MKPGAVFSVLLFSLISTLGQGTVVFNNFSPNTNYRITTNSASGTCCNLMLNTGDRYRIGLYVRPHTLANFELVAVTSNTGLSPGYFTGISELALPGFAPGQKIHFQIRAWSTHGGSSWESALAASASDFTIQLGASAYGVTSLGGNGAAPGRLFGTNVGQLSQGFVIGICCFANPPVTPHAHHVPMGLSTFAVPYPYINNTVSDLLPVMPEGTQLYKLARTPDTARWTINQYQSGAWTNPDEKLLPEEGAFIRNPTNAFTIQFEGWPTALFSRAAPVYPGANLLWFQEVHYDVIPNEFDSAYVWNGTAYNPQYLYFGGTWYDSSSNPTTLPTNRTEAFLYVRQGSPAPNPAPAVFFHNRVPAASLDKPIKINRLGCTGTNLVALLQISYNGGAFQDVGPAVPVLPDGYLDTRTNLLRELQPGGLPSQVRVRVWDGRFPTYAAAQSAFALIGESFPFNLGPLPAGPPVNMPDFIDTVGPTSPFYEDPFPHQITALAGDSAHFTFSSVLGTQFGYTFQWQRTAPFDPTNPPNPLVWTDIPGANSSSYHISRVKVNDAAYYRVFMTYYCTNRASRSVYLNVIPFNFSQSAVRGPGNLLTFDIQSQAGLNYRLFSSVDLETWTPGPIYSNRPTHWSLSLTNGAGAREFFRLGVVP